MVSKISALSLFLSFFLLFSLSTATPVIKDAATKQYVTVIGQRTPLVPIKLTVDLGQRFSWVDCEKGYTSSSFKPVLCSSPTCKRSFSSSCDKDCSLSPFPKSGCTDSNCVHDPYNPFNSTSTVGEVATDYVSLQSTNGSNPGRFISASGIVFGCSSTFMLEKLAIGVKGIAGLGNGFVGLPYQITSALRLSRKFTICSSSSATSKGVIFFGNSPYVFLPGIDVSKRLTYTPLLKNPVSTSGSYIKRERSMEYLIGVKSIKLNGKIVPINTTLTISKNGIGGTKISTVDPYTKLETSIYNAFTMTFVKSLAKVPRVKAVAPFKVCYKRTSFVSTRVGSSVPPSELVLGSKKATSSGTIFGAHSKMSFSVLDLWMVELIRPPL